MYGNPYMQQPMYNPMGQQNMQQNPFTQYFANMFSQQPQMNPQQSSQPPQQGWTIPCVKGKEGIEKFFMPPRSEALIMDEDEPIVWLVKTDDAGVKSVIQPLQFSVPEDPEKQRMS